MRLGRDTNSLTNFWMAGTVGQPAPAVGMGVTLLHWTDRSAGTIVRISPTGKTFWFQADIVTRIDKNGMSEDQHYEYKPDKNATIQKAFKSTDGSWRVEKSRTRVRLGDRSAYHDYSF